MIIFSIGRRLQNHDATWFESRTSAPPALQRPLGHASRLLANARDQKNYQEPWLPCVRRSASPRPSFRRRRFQPTDRCPPHAAAILERGSSFQFQCFPFHFQFSLNSFSTLLFLDSPSLSTQMHGKEMNRNERKWKVVNMQVNFFNWLRKGSSSTHRSSSEALELELLASTMIGFRCAYGLPTRIPCGGFAYRPCLWWFCVSFVSLNCPAN